MSLFPYVFHLIFFPFWLFYNGIILFYHPQASNNFIASLPEDLVCCKKLVKVDVEVK